MGRWRILLQISADQMIRMQDTLPGRAMHGKPDQLQPTSLQLDQPTLSGLATVSLAAARALDGGPGDADGHYPRGYICRYTRTD